MSDSTHSEAPRPSSNNPQIEQLRLEITHLSQELAKVQQEKADLEIMLETIADHGDVIEEKLQKEAEAAKQESRERFRLIAEATPITILISRLSDGEVLYANAAATSMFSLPMQELLGRSVLDFYSDPNDRKKLLDIYAKNGSLRNYEIRLKKQDETVFWGAISLQPFSLYGEEVLLTAILDVTKRKQSEVDRIRFTQALKEKHGQLKRLSELKDEFLINTSNELCTPLNQMVHLVQSLLEKEAGEFSQTQQQKLSTIAQSGHQLFNLVNNIRDFSKLRQGDMELHWQAVNVRSLTEKVLQSSQTLVSHKDLQLVNSIPVDLPNINADEQRLQQILQSLVAQAINLTEHGCVEISAVVDEFQQQGTENLEQLVITVADTGAGISEDKLEDILELFNQADYLAIQQSETNDLQLSLTKALVELHGGKIWVESEVGFGTRFIFTLPFHGTVTDTGRQAAIAPTSSHLQPSERAAIKSIMSATKTPILIATDSPPGISGQTTVATLPQTAPTPKRTQRKLLRTLGKVPLRVILIVPFVVQVVGAVGLVGYLSFKNGQKVVNDLANQLRSEVSARVHDRIQTYVEVPQQVNQFNAHAIQLGLLDFQNVRKAELYFWRQVQTYESIGNAGFANEQGQFLRVGWINRLSTTEQPQIAEQLTPGGGTLRYYNIDPEGNRLNVAKTVLNYDTRTRPYYTAAVKQGKPTWSEVYINTGYDLLQIKASRPFYDRKGELLGVLACELGIDQIGKFLQTLKIGRSGEVFIMEPSGELVASSISAQPLLVGRSKNAKRLRALESNDLLMRSSAAFLRDRFGHLKNIQKNYQLEFKLNNQRQFLQVSSFRDGYGLDWLIVVVVPESDFMQQIHANNRITFFLCIVTLMAAILIGILTVRWVTEPLIRLNFAAKDIAKGEWDKAVELDRSDEVGQLAQSFNDMAGQLKESFEILENHKNAFARFFPLEYLKFLQKQYVTHVHLGDHVSKEMAVMFSDIRSFTTLSESMTPQDTFSFVNAYLQRVGPAIRNHNGIIVKYLGDGLMAIFPNGADDAVRAGIAKLKRIRDYNQHRQARGYQLIQAGIGIHLGYILVGMVGEENRMQGDALSDSVNLTARLEGLTKFYGVSMLISEQVLERLNDPSQYEIRFLDRAIVKGKTESISIYEVMDGEPEEVKALKFQTQSDFEQGLEYYRRREFAEAKRYFEQVLAVNLSDKTAQLYLERVHQLMEEGVPENWDGVWTFDQK
ncbi:ATP-binding protein [Allocoleopsis franciscana]|uniref:histidine kinase n=1 Tax=Allocoleopsis franciscana PCC 7113 TaxID=1173027 RepID=K9WFY1_9CYAN|nr:adenylate/guanylate cyclase domain-containing protein [Allocoleopsis franciscana]AFZ19330.1 PAS domain S-box [Allocoleopsis franciscana PCC 7113]